MATAASREFSSRSSGIAEATGSGLVAVDLFAVAEGEKKLTGVSACVWLVAMNFDQGEFNFEAPGSDAGWRRWREELDERRRAFEARWGVVLGRRVTVCLADHAKPLTGMLEWLEAPKADGNAPPRFRLRGLEFGVGEIESIVQEDCEVS